MRGDGIIPYLDLIRSFLEGAIGAEAFEHSYLEMFKHDETLSPGTTFLILDRLFSDVDAFCGDPQVARERQSFRAAIT